MIMFEAILAFAIAAALAIPAAGHDPGDPGDGPGSEPVIGQRLAPPEESPGQGAALPEPPPAAEKPALEPSPNARQTGERRAETPTKRGRALSHLRIGREAMAKAPESGRAPPGALPAPAAIGAIDESDRRWLGYYGMLALWLSIP
jgi:hypothetical protein